MNIQELKSIKNGSSMNELNEIHAPILIPDQAYNILDCQ